MKWLGSIRSIVTIMVVGTFCFLGVMGKIGTESITSVTMLILGFYFVTKERKENNKK